MCKIAILYEVCDFFLLYVWVQIGESGTAKLPGEGYCVSGMSHQDTHEISLVKLPTTRFQESYSINLLT